MINHMAMDENVVESLSFEDRKALKTAVEAVVSRDAGRVRALLADPEDAASFWIWADDYGRYGRLSLVAPPGPIDGWEITGVALSDGSGLALDLPMGRRLVERI